MNIKAVLFDLDGTLVDSNAFHIETWHEVFAAAGHRINRQAIHAQIGKGGDMLVPSLLPEATEEEVTALGEAHGAVFRDRYLGRVQAFPGARDLLMRVRDAGQEVVLASSAHQAELAHYLDLLDVREVVAATTSGDDVAHTKPAPDIFAAALRKVAPIGPAEAVVVGDTPYDMLAAGRCGITAVGVRTGNFSDDVLQRSGASALYDDVAALLAGYDQSPLAGTPPRTAGITQEQE